MKIQKSRYSKQALKDYSAVCHQQGRMLTDSDLTEQALISRDRLNQALKDVIGSGTPRHNALLQVTESGDDRIPALHWGSLYVDGVPAEVRAADDAPDADAFSYDHQLYYPQAPELPESAHRLYVDVWERTVIWLQDEMLRDPGLHGADTTTRTQTVAQVKWCDAETDPLCPDVNPAIGDARLRLVLRSLSTSADPCDPCADELELNDPVGNYLFRVEIHDVNYDDADQPDALVLKWSSENGAEAYKTADVPPDFASNQYVYEFFDDVTEQRLGIHLGRDGTADNERLIDGSRPGLVETFSDAAPEAREYVRRWDGWCRLEKSGSDWQLSEGFEGSIDLSSGIGAGRPGHVTQGGDAVSIELQVISLSIELADHALVSGDYWTAPVRESIHQQGDVLLEDSNTGTGSPPQGERHHTMLLVDVDADGVMTLPTGSECDAYQACRLPQFPSLTDLRADDICYENDACQMPDVETVQDALDHLCQENDLRWHNRHMHGWGIVCGLTLECHDDDRASVMLRSGYALDCDGTDMVIKKDRPVNVLALMEKAGIDPQQLDEDQGVCLYLEHSDEQSLEVGVELYEHDRRQGLMDRLKETLLYEFYEDCVKGLVDVFTGELQQGDVRARCTLTECGEKLIRPVRRRTLTLANLLFHRKQGESETVLNISHCEHLLLKDLYDRLKKHLRSKTFCAQFENADFPPYPFDVEPCRSTWFTPELLDHIRVHPKEALLFGWERDSSRIFVFRQLKEGCLGDLLGHMDVPQLDGGSITDVTIDANNVIHVSGIVHKEDTLIGRGKLDLDSLNDCTFKLDWEVSFICGVRVVQFKQSPWNEGQFYALALCRGAYLFESEELFANEKIDPEPHWHFPASGHMQFDVQDKLVFATAFENPASNNPSVGCEDGDYNRVVFFHHQPISGEDIQPVVVTSPRVGQKPIRGSDGFVLTHISGQTPGRPDDVISPDVRLSTSNISRTLVMYLVVDEGSNKVLCRFQAGSFSIENDQSLSWHGTPHHAYGAAERVSLTYLRTDELDGIAASRFLMHDMQYVPGDPKLYQAEYGDPYENSVPGIPLQAGPVEVIKSHEHGQLYALNHTGQSITVLNLKLAIYHQQREELRKYREDVIAAFYNLLSGLMQYLKDCFCQHLLVECPECDEDDKVYLGCLSIDDNEIQHICNFTKRKYVKSFPTVSYWLSLIPVGPLVAWLVEEFCCLVLPNYFRDRDSRNLAISPMQMTMAKAVVNTDQANMVAELSDSGQTMVKRSMTNLIGTGYKNKSGYDDMIGQKYRYKPGVFRVRREKITSDRVLVRRVEDIDIERIKSREKVEGLKAEVARLHHEKAEVETRFTALETDYNDVLVKKVDTVVAEKAQADEEVKALKLKITQLERQKAESDERVVKLEQGIGELEEMRVALRPVIAGAKPVSSIAGIKPEQVQLLERNNITTVKQLSEANAAKLREMGMHINTARSLIKKARLLLKGRG